LQAISPCLGRFVEAHKVKGNTYYNINTLLYPIASCSQGFCAACALNKLNKQMQTSESPVAPVEIINNMKGKVLIDKCYKQLFLIVGYFNRNNV
jgi:hypothetical protein